MDAPKDPTLTPNIPPPPAEVKVRTMHSDIEGVANAGGGAPQFRTVSVEGMGLPKSRIGGSTDAQSASSSGNGFPWWIVILGVGVLGIIIWFGYAILSKK